MALLGALPPLLKWPPVLLESGLPGAFADATARNTSRSRGKIISLCLLISHKCFVPNLIGNQLARLSCECSLQASSPTVQC